MPRKTKTDYATCVACEGKGYKSRPSDPANPKCGCCGGLGMTKTEVPVETPVEAPVAAATEASAPVQHSSASNEHYTPKAIVDAARTVLGGIDLDPASCELGNSVVGALAWYGPGSELAEDGLAEPWLGRVFLNPPGGLVPEAYKGLGTKSNAALWWAALAGYWAEGEVEAAIFVGFTLEVLRSTQALDVPQPLDFPMCVPKSRIAFDTDEGGERVGSSSPSHANVIVYLPPVKTRTAKAIRSYGRTNVVQDFVKAFGGIGYCRT